MTKSLLSRWLRPIFLVVVAGGFSGGILVLLAMDSRHQESLAVAQRNLAGESGLPSGFAQLRRDYGGRVPMQPGDPVPLIDGDATAEALRVFLRDTHGRARIASELLSEVPEGRRRCELHGTAPVPRVMPILYGLYQRSSAYAEAERQRFPRAATPCLGGCIEGAADEAIVLSCEACEAEKQRFASEQLPHRPRRDPKK